VEYQLFHITNKALIFHKNKFLLMKSDDPDFLGALECPGGRVNRGEIIAETLEREIKEEIGLDLAKIPHKIDLFTLNQRDEVEYDWDEYTQIIEIYYKVVVPDEVELKIDSLEESSELVWIDTQTNLDEFLYRVESRKNVYKKAQLTLQLLN